MPPNLQAELAKNQDASVQRGPKPGEEIYMFQLQTKEVLALLKEVSLDKTHEQLMNIWHTQHLEYHNNNQIGKPGNATKQMEESTGKTKSAQLNALQLANSPMCVEMMLSCGKGMHPFDVLLTSSNIQALTSEGGGLLLSVFWLDIYVWNMVKY
jgi:hypothetical protein